MNFFSRAAAVHPIETPAARTAALLTDYSVEITGAENAVREALDCGLPAGTEIFIAFVPGERVERIVAAARALRRAGYAPAPHIVARSFASAAALEACVAALAEAGAERALTIAGDGAHPAGPFDCALAAMRTGVFRRHGFRRLYFAVHPEGHPIAPAATMRRALEDKIRFARDDGIEAALVSQFTLDARPLIACLADLPEAARDAPFRLGFAGPTSAKTLLKYALYCGVGTSLKALGGRGAAMGGLIAQERPGLAIAETAAALAAGETAARVEGAHFFTFGGVSRTAAWVNGELARLGGGA